MERVEQVADLDVRGFCAQGIVGGSGYHHPHVHCVVPAGGLSPDHCRWIPAANNFFLPVKALSRVFRGKFVAGLRRLHAAVSRILCKIISPSYFFFVLPISSPGPGAWRWQFGAESPV